MNEPFLSVVIPAYNEEERLADSLEKILSYLSSRNCPAEIIVVDDGSRDGTAEIAESCIQTNQTPFEIRLLHSNHNQGKGHSVRRGMVAARGSYALLTDADLSTPIEEITKLETPVVEGPFDIAMGSRSLPDSIIQVQQSWWRTIGGKVFNWLVRRVAGLPYRDTQCGFKLFSMAACREIFHKQTVEDFGFDVEVAYIAQKWSLKILEVPVIWRHAPGTKVRLMFDSFRMLLDLFKIRWNDRRGKYDKTGSQC